LIKEQVIDLNDKLDYLVTILMKNRKLGVKKTTSLDHQNIKNTEFVIGGSENKNEIEDQLDINEQFQLFKAKAQHDAGVER
jgi:hypothetical protein